MIDIVTEKELDLRNVTQIGTPGAEEKIYVANSVYTRIHMDEYKEKRAFVLMGHTTCTNGKYTTFVETAIPVRQMEFDQYTPVWNNRVWSEVFAEIKRSYEEYIIVGWALDLEGVPPEITPDIEAIHREHFGGVHQLLYLLDSFNGLEYFYQNKNNHLYRRNGFYLFYDAIKNPVPRTRIEIEVPKQQVKSVKEMPVRKSRPKEQNVEMPRGAYREMLLSQQKRKKQKKDRGSFFGVVAVVALLVAIAGAAISKNPNQMQRVSSFFQSVGNQISETFAPDEKENGERILFSTQQLGKEKEGITESTETNAEIIPIEKVDGEIPTEKE